MSLSDLSRVAGFKSFFFLFQCRLCLHQVITHPFFICIFVLKCISFCYSLASCPHALWSGWMKTPGNNDIDAPGLALICLSLSMVKTRQIVKHKASLILYFNSTSVHCREDNLFPVYSGSHVPSLPDCQGYVLILAVILISTWRQLLVHLSFSHMIEYTDVDANTNYITAVKHFQN